MGFLNSKRLKELELENEELRNNLKRINNKEEKVKQLEEVQRRLRDELTQLTQAKSNHSTELTSIIDKEKEAKVNLEKYSSELKRLQEMKANEQNDLLTLTGKLETIKNNIKDYDPNIDVGNLLTTELNEKITGAEKKKDLLIGENIKLEETARELAEKVALLKKEEEQLITATFKINEEAKLDELDEEIKKMHGKGTEEIKELQKRIETFKNEETAIKDRIELRKSELEEIENSTIKDSSTYKKETEENMIALIVEEQKLLESIEDKNKIISKLSAKLEQLKSLDSKATEQIQKKFEVLKSKEIELRGNINLLQLQLKDKAESLNNTGELETKLASLKEEEQNLNDKVANLTETENYKQAALNELNDKVSAKEIELKALSQDYDKSANQLNEIFIKKGKMVDEVGYKQKELLAIVQSLNAKNERLKSLRNEVEEFEEKTNTLKSENDKYETIRSEVNNDLNQMRDEVNKLAEEKLNLTSYLSESEAKNSELEKSNQALEVRFSDMFQKFNKEINQTNQKRNVLEQILTKKEADLEEKDRSLNEKLNALEETERMLTLRQAEIDSFDDLLKTINEQKELIKNDLINLDGTAADRKNFNKDLRMETEFLQKKMSDIEKDMNELLAASTNRMKNNIERKQMLEGEITEYESRLYELNNSIKDSMNELVDLKSSISKIKLEHEEHRLSIAKYASIKRKLDEEIIKNKTLLNKYRQIRERIKIEQTTMSRLKENKDEIEKHVNKDETTVTVKQKAREVFKL